MIINYGIWIAACIEFVVFFSYWLFNDVSCSCVRDMRHASWQRSSCKHQKNCQGSNDRCNDRRGRSVTVDAGWFWQVGCRWGVPCFRKYAIFKVLGGAVPLHKWINMWVCGQNYMEGLCPCPNLCGVISQCCTTFTLWLFNIAMEAMAHRNRWFSQLETSIYKGFPMAMLVITRWYMRTILVPRLQ